MEDENELVFTRRSNLENIADSIRARLHSIDTYAPGDMAGAIDSIIQGISAEFDDKGLTSNPLDNHYDIDEWTRPQEWPGISEIQIDVANNEEVLYLTYCNTEDDGSKWMGIAFAFDTVGAYMTVERGTVANGVFTPYTLEQSQSAAKTGTGNVYFYYEQYGET